MGEGDVCEPIVDCGAGLGLVDCDSGLEPVEARGDRVIVLGEDGVAAKATIVPRRRTLDRLATMSLVRLCQRVKKTKAIPAGQHKTRPTKASHDGTADEVGRPVAGWFSGELTK